MTEWITTHLTSIVAPLAVVAALGYALKKIPDILANKAIEYMEKAFAVGDPNDDILFVAILVWIEKKMGNATGPEKLAALVEKAVNLIPLPYRLFVNDKAKGRARELLQAVYDRLKSAFDAQIAEHKGIPADNVPPIP